MRKLSEIERQIADFQAQVDALMEQKGNAESALEDARRRYSKSIVSSESVEQNAEHRKAVTELTVDADALNGAVSLVEEDLQKAENEKNIIHLFQTEGKRHHDNMGTLEKSVAIINRDLPKLSTLVDKLSDAIRGAFTGVEISASSLHGISTDLDSGLNLEAFLDGHLTAVGDENRESLINDIGNDIRDNVSSLDVPEKLNFTEIESLLERLPRWKAAVGTFTGIGLIKNPKELAKPVSKRPSTQRVSIPIFPHSSPIERPKVPSPRFDKNKPRHQQRILA